MKKIMAACILMMSVSSFSSDIIGDLQYKCIRSVMSYNHDIKPILIFNASTYFDKKKVIIVDAGSLIETSYKKIEGGMVITYDAGYENENELTVLFGDNYKTPSQLVLGDRTVRMNCSSTTSL
ncbi:hypothetical protein HBN50_03415 [Halobacteriovorax sp. GB3]|uniref:hypothetical protein n=1 Tax=Halobacteriovorax sp. GB3 TaxID=2719615 RepID=UPI00236295FC|nr:hypothetical protein [Halobacteriovorax sp. GB3]MDD0852126.1 hypothetical protein [Halobacteriovorax sp. GB3]